MLKLDNYVINIINNMSSSEKFISKDGVLIRNPAYVAPVPSKKVTTSKTAIDYPCTQQDLELAQELTEANGKTFEVPMATAVALEAIVDDSITTKFNCEIDADEVLRKLTEEFARYEVPLGLLNKLLILTEWDLHFIIDDSGSMSMNSDGDCSDFGNYMTLNYHKKNGVITRWEEVQNNVHNMLDILAYIPINITVSYMNRKVVHMFKRNGDSPDVFKENSHKAIMAEFKSGPNGGTPTDSALQSALSSHKVKTLTYLFTDGEPNNGAKSVENVIASRKNVSNMPVTFISCTNEDSATEWMKGIDEKYENIAELDDFKDERVEIEKKQGQFLPYSKGLWLISMLVAAISPNDLDILDESRPLTKTVFENIIGRQLMEAEYKKYWDNCPCAKGQNYANFYK